jgi:hypothetical protein
MTDKKKQDEKQKKTRNISSNDHIFEKLTE